MKKALLILIFLMITQSLFFTNHVIAIDNCCGKGGRCTGSSYCTACSNCSRCAYCASGGTCGVCSSRYISKSSTPTRTYKRYSTKKYTASSSYKLAARQAIQNTSATIDQQNTKEILMVNKAILSIRKKASINALIIEKVRKNTRLIKLKTLIYWYQVKVEKTGTIGYVYKKDLN